MNIEKGEVYGFLGKNGCGKTTTMNIICNVIPKDSGRIVFDNPASALAQPPAVTPNPDLAKDPAVQDGAVENGEYGEYGEYGNYAAIGEYAAPEPPRVKIGYLTETPALFGYMNGYEYLRYIAACANYQGNVQSRVAEVLDITGMTEGARRRIKGYSRGMNQRLGIAAAIFDNPQLLILDEPTSALDPEGRAEVMRIIETLKAAGTTIILCTHIISDVERVADRVGIMGNGYIIEEGAVADIVRKYNIQSAQMSVILREPNERDFALMRGHPLVTASFFDEKAGRVILNSDNINELSDGIVKIAAENNIKISELSSHKINLEEIYMRVTGAANGTGF